MITSPLTTRARLKLMGKWIAAHVWHESTAKWSETLERDEWRAEHERYERIILLLQICSLIASNLRIEQNECDMFGKRRNAQSKTLQKTYQTYLISLVRVSVWHGEWVSVTAAPTPIFLPWAMCVIMCICLRYIAKTNINKKQVENRIFLRTSK